MIPFTAPLFISQEASEVAFGARQQLRASSATRHRAANPPGAADEPSLRNQLQLLSLPLWTYARTRARCEWTQEPRQLHYILDRPSHCKRTTPRLFLLLIPTAARAAAAAVKYLFAFSSKWLSCPTPCPESDLTQGSHQLSCCFSVLLDVTETDKCPSCCLTCEDRY